ncbi:hypothetical protein NDK47_22135 [Brevibacillus ruminantium]|uniref:DUF4367 domain-containing protein n=1 Tax=Brevibacillus ruminantium TaxID=2950604 RepID=A0ABY4WG41_9BACL|nr:hypothetical protein [Brevibacillus ruminantium]USG64795.1 hypothetical protein NDK47_22135 [Brevibacillus ruminantium]
MEELRRFPDQSLPWERSRVILENIREEHRRTQHGKRRKKFAGILASGIVTCAVLFAILTLKPSSLPVETSESHAGVGVDQQYLTAAQKEIKAIGINKEFPFEEIEHTDEYVIVRAKDREAIVTFKPNTTEVRSVSAHYSINELTNLYQKYVETARDAFLAANQQVTLQTAHFFKDDKGTSLSFGIDDDKQYVRVDLKTNTVSDFSLHYKLNDVDKKYVDIAERALMLLSNQDRFSFTQANKSTQKNEEFWTFTNEKEKYSVRIGAKTGQVYSVKYVTDRYKITSLEEAISVPKPLIQDLFGIDLTGYQAYGGRNWGGYVLKCQGKPNIVININNLDRGDIATIRVEWEK